MSDKTQTGPATSANLAKSPGPKMAEAVRVIVRCRPINERERKLACQVIVDMKDDRGLCKIIKPDSKTQPPKEFTFDGVYFIDSTTEQIYNDVAYPLVEGVVEGYNGTVFAYGQTGCGKSFSMQGITSPPTQRGIIPRAFSHIFESISVAENTKYLVHASYLEIYNEDVRDLLSKNIKDKLELKEHPDKGVYVKDLSKFPCSNVKDCEKVMATGWNNRAVGATLMNADSSRSHSIFTIYMEACGSALDGGGHIRAGKLNLVDLAGSERQSKTGSTGDRLKEATKINLSLSALGNVISALVDGKSKHIPYRDSKLTRLLQDSLGGNTKTLMVACISPADNNYDETLSTLRYANRAKNIKNKPKINEDPKDALLREYQEEIMKLRELLAQQGPGGAGITNEDLMKAKAEKEEAEKRAKAAREEAEKKTKAEKEKAEKIKREYQKKLEKLKKHYETEQLSNAKLQQDMKKLQSEYNQQMQSADASVAAVQKELASSTGSSVSDADFYPVVQEAIEQQTSEGAKPFEAVVQDFSKLSKEEIMQQHEEALKRLQIIQENMVGGELSKDEEAKKRIVSKKKHVDERKRRLAEAAMRDDDEAMLDVYDSINKDVQQRNKQIEVQKKKIEGLKMEIEDISYEFERDRTEYLQSIRKQSQEIDLLKAIIQKIHPTLRRDCNYSNLDKIRTDAKYDENNDKWIVPDLHITKTSLPSAVSSKSTGSNSARARSNTASEYSSSSVESLGDAYTQRAEDDRYLAKLNQSKGTTAANNYFAPKRQVKQIISSSYNSTNGLFSNGGMVIPPLERTAPPPFHGTDEPARRPHKLESLDAAASKMKKKKRSQDMS